MYSLSITASKGAQNVRHDELIGPYLSTTRALGAAHVIGSARKIQHPKKQPPIKSIYPPLERGKVSK